MNIKIIELFKSYMNIFLHLISLEIDVIIMIINLFSLVLRKLYFNKYISPGLSNMPDSVSSQVTDDSKSVFSFVLLIKLVEEISTKSKKITLLNTIN